MSIDPQTRTTLYEIADGFDRINTPVDLSDGQRSSFNRYLLVDDGRLPFHAGPRNLFPLVRRAIAAAKHTVPDCSQVAAGVSIGDLADRTQSALACTHRIAWSGDGAPLLRNLGRVLS